MNRDELNIGTYYFKREAWTEKNVRELAECGIDFVAGMENSPEILDLFYRYGIGAVVSGVVPGWFGGDGTNAGTMADSRPLSLYREAAERFTDHPAIWGIDAGDEPSSRDFVHYGKVTEEIARLFPGKFPYLNLYPNYAVVPENTAVQREAQLGCATYAEYVRRFTEHVPLDYFCFDYYLCEADAAGAWESMRSAAEACRASGRSMWTVLQVNSQDPLRWTSADQLRHQAYLAMAFGAEVILWACYSGGWWHNPVLDKTGVKTEQYEKLKAVNAEIHRIGEEYMRYRWQASRVCADSPAEAERVFGTAECAARQEAGVFCGVHAEDGRPLLMGHMLSRTGDGGEALMICAAREMFREAGEPCRIRFSAPGRAVRVLGGQGELPVSRGEDGSFSVMTDAYSGVLIAAE